MDKDENNNIGLRSVILKPWSREFKDVKKLYLDAFPKEERFRIQMLRKLTKKNGYRCTAFYDGDIFVGFTFVLYSDNTVFVLYFAVNTNLRAKGYGSMIQKKMFESFPNAEFVCHVEPLIPEAPNYEQRLKRVRFYERLGLIPTGYATDDDGVWYWVMSNRGRDFDRSAYEKLFFDLEGEEGVPKLYPVDRSKLY